MSPSATPAIRRQQMISKLGYLSEIDLFQDLPTDDAAWMEEITTVTTFERGHVLYMPQEQDQVLFLLKHGRVQIYRVDADGKKVIVSTIGPGTLFGEMALLGQGMNNTYAEAIEDCTVAIISRDDLEKVFVEKPQIGLRILEVVGLRLREAEARLEDITFKNIPARLASLLLRLSREGTNQITGYTHQDLAEMIGTYRETTTQTLNHFKGQGLLDIGRKRIEIRDRRGLERLADL